jgi:hypothetical protein
MTIALEKPKPLTISIFQRYDATWQDYLALRDSEEFDWKKISFHQGWLWADMGTEGPGHAGFSDLMTMIFGFWAYLHPEIPFQSYGRCLMDLPESHACAPDLVLYKGENIPRWKLGEPRRIDLARHRLPDLVGEIADTSLSLDLDEQKRLYASLGIAEYWVIDVKGARLFAFALEASGNYEPIDTSRILEGLPIVLLEQTLERLVDETNTAAANWFMKQCLA